MISQNEVNKSTDSDFRERFVDLAPKTVGVIPWLVEPSFEQKEWFVHKMKATARCWDTCIPHKPWILRWQYFILEDYSNGC